MQIFFELVKTITLFVLFFSCFENLISNEANKKIYRFLCGLIIICIVIGKFDELIFGFENEIMTWGGM